MVTTKAELERLAHVSNKRLHLMTIAHRDQALNRPVDAVERWSEDGWKYTAKLYRSDGAEGGYVTLIGRVAGQSDNVDVYWLQDFATAASTDWRLVAERFRIVQRRKLRGEEA